jgi:hypothetical protein
MLRVENEVVPLGAEVDRSFLAEENECKDIAVLQSSISILQHACIYDNSLYVRGRVRTFAWHWAKNFSGSIP